MFSNRVNLNYFLGFVVVLLIMGVLMLALRPRDTTRIQDPHYNLASPVPPKSRLTLITRKGPSNMTYDALDHYLTDLSNKLTHVIKSMDVGRCSQIASRIHAAQKAFSTYLTELTESRNLTPEQCQELEDVRAQVKTRLNTVSHALFDNDQNEDQIQIMDTMYEIERDVETLMFLIRDITRSPPELAHTLDISSIDQIIDVIYTAACPAAAGVEVGSVGVEVGVAGVEMGIVGDAAAGIAHDTFVATPARSDWKGVITDVNDIDLDPQSLTFGTFIDRYKHQDIKAETDTLTAGPWSSPQSGLSARKKSIKSARVQAFQVKSKPDTHSPTPSRSVKINPRDAPGMSSEVRLKTAQENFALERPNRHKKRQTSLMDVYQDA